jgi:hypothetical protein
MGLSGGGGTGGGAIRAGQAFVELIAKDNALLRALDRAKQRMQAFGATVVKAGAATAAAGAGLLAPVAGLFDAAVKRGSALANLADEFGTTAESLSSLAYAFGTAGVAQEEFIDTVKGLSQKLAEGADGSDELFTRLGLSAKELIALPVDQQFAKIADALAAVGNAADRTNIGLQLFGGAGSKLTRVLAQGSGELARLRGEAEDVGAVMRGETAQSAQRLERSLSRAWTAAANAILAVGEALFPTAEGFDGIIRAVTAAAAAARAFIQENKALVVGVAAVGGTLVAAGGAAVVLGTAVAGLGALIGVATGAVSLLGSVVTALISPLGLAAAAVGGLGYLFVAHTATGKALAAVVGGGLADAWGTLRDAALDAWGGITSALSRGDLARAGEIALAGLSVAWQQGLLTLQKAWNATAGYVQESWASAGKFLGDAFLGLTYTLREVWAAFTEFMVDAYTRAIAAAAGAGSDLARTVGLGDLAGALDDYARESRRAAELDARLAERARDARLDGLGKEALARDRAADAARREREEARDAALAGRAGALDAARARLAELTAAERDAARAAAAPRDKLADRVAALADTVAKSVHGATGVTDFRSVFAVGDSVASRALRVQEQTRDGIKRVEKAIKDAPGPVFG